MLRLRFFFARSRTWMSLVMLFTIASDSVAFSRIRDIWPNRSCSYYWIPDNGNERRVSSQISSPESTACYSGLDWIWVARSIHLFAFEYRVHFVQAGFEQLLSGPKMILARQLSNPDSLIAYSANEPSGNNWLRTAMGLKSPDKLSSGSASGPARISRILWIDSTSSLGSPSLRSFGGAWVVLDDDIWWTANSGLIGFRMSLASTQLRHVLRKTPHATSLTFLRRPCSPSHKPFLAK